jgi:hypothetical protein
MDAKPRAGGADGSVVPTIGSMDDIFPDLTPEVCRNARLKAKHQLRSVDKTAHILLAKMGITTELRRQLQVPSRLSASSWEWFQSKTWRDRCLLALYDNYAKLYWNSCIKVTPSVL